LRTLPSVVHVLLAGLAGEGDEVLLAAGARFQAEQVLALERLEERLAAEKLRRLALFDRSGGALALRSRSTKGFLRTHGQMSLGRASRLVGLARELDRLPVVRCAQAAGGLSADQVGVLARELAPVEDEAARVAAQELLVAHAPGLHLVQLRQAARQLHAHLVPESEGEAGVDAPGVFRSWVRLSRTGSSSDPFWVLSGELSPVVGEKLRSALEAAAGVPAAGDGRSQAERMGEGLGVVTDLALGVGVLPVVGGQRPHLTVVADLDALRASGCPVHPALALDVLDEADVVGDGLAGLLRPRVVATTGWGYGLPGWQLRKEACDCRLRVVLTGGRERPVSVGRAMRTVPAYLRDVVVARDRHCVWPGCDRPPSWCEAHHLVHWADGGETGVENLALLCGEHHQDLHRTGWELVMRDGRPEAVPPPDTPPPPNSRHPAG
ncbi:HNH endonuclease signature motif containing protein, partial [Streptacidiphilus jiangxiensis]|uniref:HNH endonuclease signature motif containing protein n=1 Tax=Streptacidiphilus jiangxiensis TaxID=235985 RepID=UPI00126A4073